MAENGGPPKISAAQARGIAAIIQYGTLEEAAAAANVGERTLQRWRQNPTFLTALAAAESELIGDAARRAAGMISSALDTIDGILADPDIPAAVRLKAALGLLDRLIPLRDLATTEQRLVMLESLVSEKMS